MIDNIHKGTNLEQVLKEYGFLDSATKIGSLRIKLYAKYAKYLLSLSEEELEEEVKKWEIE